MKSNNSAPGMGWCAERWKQQKINRRGGSRRNLWQYKGQKHFKTTNRHQQQYHHLFSQYTKAIEEVLTNTLENVCEMVVKGFLFPVFFFSSFAVAPLLFVLLFSTHTSLCHDNDRYCYTCSVMSPIHDWCSLHFSSKYAVAHGIDIKMMPIMMRIKEK